MMESSDIIETVYNQDIGQLSAVLQQDGIDINFRDNKGKTALFIAAQNGFRDCLVLLLSRGADIEIRDDSGYTAFHIAVECGKYEVTKILLEHNPEINVRDSVWGSVPIVCAAYWGYEEIVELLLPKNPDMTQCAVFGYSALGASCLKGYMNIAVQLLQHGGSDIEHKTANGATPLLLATSSGHLDIIEPLLEYGADINAVDNTGVGILHMLSGSDNDQFIQSLIQNCNADINVQDKSGATPLHIAVTEHQLENVKTLVRSGANTAIQDKTGSTCLHIAATKGLNDILSFLTSVGVNASIKNSEGLQAIECAYVNKHSYLVEVLKRVSSLSMEAVERAETQATARPPMHRSQSAPIPAPRRPRANSNVSVPPSSVTHRNSYIVPIPSPIPSPIHSPSTPSFPRSQNTASIDEEEQSEPEKHTLSRRLIPSRQGMYDEINDPPYPDVVARPLPVSRSTSGGSSDSYRTEGSGYQREQEPVPLPKKAEHKARRFQFGLPNPFKKAHKERTMRPDESTTGALRQQEQRRKELERVRMPAQLRDTVAAVFIPFSKVVLRDLIGRGNFGRVYAGQLETAGGLKDVAIKAATYKQGESEMAELFLKEALMMNDLEHMHVLNLIGITFDLESNPMAIIPFMAHGNLRAYIRDPSRQFTVVDLLQLAIQAGRGMQYLALKKVIHRDLACRNCMIDENAIVKVADFGLSRDLYHKDYYRISDKYMPLPVRWMAPESLKDHIFVQKSDVWSYGVLLWELLTRGGTPYENVENWDISRYIAKGHRLAKPEFCPKCVYGVMKQCWQRDPEDRPTFESIVKSIENSLHDLTIGLSMQVSTASHPANSKVYFV